jgi:hypothetical protein
LPVAPEASNPSITVGDGPVWPVTPAEALCWRIAPTAERSCRVDFRRRNVALVAETNDAVWLGSPDGPLTEMDPRPTASTASSAWLGGEGE